MGTGPIHEKIFTIEEKASFFISCFLLEYPSCGLFRSEASGFTLMRKGNMPRRIGANAATLQTAWSAPRAAVARPGLFQALFGRTADTVRIWRRRIRERREFAELLAMRDPRTLQEFRVTRFDALREIGKPFWRP
jgi:uncharacterized protein YjiS (DUF1127 family)